MYNIEHSTFSDINTYSSIIDAYSSTTGQKINFSFCIFKNLIVSSNGHAGAVFLRSYDCFFEFNIFINCQCKNSVTDDAGNALAMNDCTIKVDHSIIDKCVEKIAAAESTISVRKPESGNFEHMNITNCVAQMEPSGSPSIESTGTAMCTMAFCHIENTSGRKAIYLCKGKISYINIIHFNGDDLLDQITNANNCCFFDVNINRFSRTNIVCQNCFSENTKINQTTVTTTLIILSKDARWNINFKCITATNHHIKFLLCGVLNLVFYL